MGFDEAVEALKTRDPRLVVQLAELCAEVDAAKAANDPTPVWDRMEAAIVALVKSTGADDELLERQSLEGATQPEPAQRKRRVKISTTSTCSMRMADLLSFRRRSPVFCFRCVLAWLERKQARRP